MERKIDEMKEGFAGGVAIQRCHDQLATPPEQQRENSDSAGQGHRVRPVVRFDQPLPGHTTPWQPGKRRTGPERTRANWERTILGEDDAAFVTFVPTALLFTSALRADHRRLCADSHSATVGGKSVSGKRMPGRRGGLSGSRRRSAAYE